MSLEQEDVGAHASKTPHSDGRRGETIDAALKRILPLRSRDEAARKWHEMDQAYLNAIVGKTPAGDRRVLCVYSVGSDHTEQPVLAALYVVQRLWQCGLVADLPRTEAELLAQILDIQQRLQAPPAELAPPPDPPAPSPAAAIEVVWETSLGYLSPDNAAIVAHPDGSWDARTSDGKELAGREADQAAAKEASAEAVGLSPASQLAWRRFGSASLAPGLSIIVEEFEGGDATWGVVRRTEKVREIVDEGDAASFEAAKADAVRAVSERLVVILNGMAQAERKPGPRGRKRGRR